MTTVTTSAAGRRSRVLCFACGKPLSAGKPHRLSCLDEQTVKVGPDCYQRAASAGDAGWQPPLGGPRLYTLEAKARLKAEAKP